MRDLLKFSVPGNPEYVKIVKSAVQSAAGVADYSLEAVDDMGIAVGEACKLITCHESNCFAKFYDVECIIEEDKMEITISDEVCAKEGIEKYMKPCMDCPNEGNLGVLVIKSLMDEVEIIKEDKKKSIRMVKNK